jgi:hypothetical protein
MRENESINMQAANDRIFEMRMRNRSLSVHAITWPKTKRMPPCGLEPSIDTVSKIQSMFEMNELDRSATTAAYLSYYSEAI